MRAWVGALRCEHVKTQEHIVCRAPMVVPRLGLTWTRSHAQSPQAVVVSGTQVSPCQNRPQVAGCLGRPHSSLMPHGQGITSETTSVTPLDRPKSSRARTLIHPCLQLCVQRLIPRPCVVGGRVGGAKGTQKEGKTRACSVPSYQHHSNARNGPLTSRVLSPQAIAHPPTAPSTRNRVDEVAAACRQHQRPECQLPTDHRPSCCPTLIQTGA